MAERNGSSAGAVFLAFLSVGLIGFGLGLLFAPLSGRETREKIRDTAYDTKDRTIETAGRAREKVEGIVEEGRGKISEVTGSVQSAVESGKEAFQHKKSELIAGIKSGSEET